MSEPQQPPVESPARDVILVRLGAGRYAVDLAGVAEVGRAPRVTRVPGLPGWLAGVANWRGRILPVLDLGSLLGAERARGAAGRLLVLTDGGVTVGVLVDQVIGTLSLTEPVAPVPAALDAAGALLLSGQAPLPDGPVAIVDVAAVIRLREDLPTGRRSA